jgi:hypothetical protein
VFLKEKFMADELLGQVVMWDERRKFFFIEYNPPGSSEVRRMFAIRESCRPDALGRISDCWVPGTLVKFSIERQMHKGEGRLIATDVRPAFREEFTGDVGAYRESGRIERFLVEHKNGFLQRPSGEHLYFQSGDVVPGYEEQFRNLVDGDQIYYGITSIVRNGMLEFRAVGIECYNDQEQAQLRQGLPLEDPPVVIPEPEPPSVLAPDKRNRTILELVKEQRNGR